MFTSQPNKWVHVFLLVGWPVAAVAAPLTFGESVARITNLEWFLVGFLSFLSGVTSLTAVFSGAANAKPPREIRSPFVYGIAHMMGSMLAGLMAFFGAAQMGFYGFSLGMVVPAFAFGGAASCQWFAKKMMGSDMTVPVAPPPTPGDQIG